MGMAGLAVGIAVLLLTLTSVTGLLGPHDFATVGLAGLVGAAFCLGIVLKSRTPAAVIGLALSLLPVGLLVFFLAISAS